ncbi:MAG: asparagine synthase (glutamine-hydrolyzing) [Acidobacteriia bacterium]|nr:asparagine synthase (glutamine-hydrolyzing) [Terriglobia bacterium]
MCGICGKLNFDPQRRIDEDLLIRMRDTLYHRGPDDGGIYIDGSMGLGVRRLAIIDLSSHGHQPLSNEDETLWIAFNGEIYNFQEIRKDLLQQGHQFRSHTDTETVVHLYERHGPDCLQYLRGMFAFAIWDKRRRRLFLARDRVGKKPLFYRADSSSFWFGSEIKAILEDPEVPRSPDYTAIHHYLAFQSVPAPWSAFEGIRKLPPGHFMVVENGRVTTERYWNLRFSPKRTVRTRRDEEDLTEEARSTVEEATRLRMISDVPLGAFLSGGVDSSAVVALMARSSSRPIRTFSIGFDQAGYNETHFARLVAERYHTDHQEFIVHPNAREVIPQLVWHYNEPFADSSAIPTFYVSKLARQHVTVALNGDGGDETFGGYDRYYALSLARKFRWLGKVVSPAVVRVLESWITKSGDPRSVSWRGRRFLRGLGNSFEEQYFDWISYFSNASKQSAYTPEFARQQSSQDSLSLLKDVFDSADAADLVDRAMQVDALSYLPDTLLTKVDIASMANSLEARSPLLDHKVMELAASLPVALKLHGRVQKYLFKKAMEPLLPPEILQRSKMGFGVPLADWLRGELAGWAQELLLGEKFRSRGIFRADFADKILREHLSGRWNWQYHIWSLVMLELWFQMFIDRPPSRQASEFVERNVALASAMK